MRFTSLYCAECLCGRYFGSETTEYTCPTCKRIIVFRPNEENSTETAPACQPTEETV